MIERFAEVRAAERDDEVPSQQAAPRVRDELEIEEEEGERVRE